MTIYMRKQQNAPKRKELRLVRFVKGTKMYVFKMIGLIIIVVFVLSCAIVILCACVVSHNCDVIMREKERERLLKERKKHDA